MADGMVDGAPANEDSYGIIQGDGGAVDKIAGNNENNILQGHAKFNQYYGGGGDDTFKLVSKYALENGTHIGESTVFDDQFAYIVDFQGAGVAGGDFIVFDGFDATTLTLNHTGATDAKGHTLYYYSVDDELGNTYNFIINSLSGSELGQGDYNFY